MSRTTIALPGRHRRPGVRCLLALFAASALLTACELDEPVIVGAGARPVITLLEVPDQVTPGGALSVVVRATGRRGIDQVTVRFRGAYVADSVTVFDPIATDTVTVTRTLTVPDTVTGLLIRVEAVATDSTGEVSRVETRDVDVLAPATALERVADQLLARLQGTRTAAPEPGAIASRHAPRPEPGGRPAQRGT